MPRARKGRQKDPIFKTTTGLCPSRCYYSMALTQPTIMSLTSGWSRGGGRWGCEPLSPMFMTFFYFLMTILFNKYRVGSASELFIWSVRKNNSDLDGSGLQSSVLCNFFYNGGGRGSQPPPPPQSCIRQGMVKFWAHGYWDGASFTVQYLPS